MRFRQQAKTGDTAGIRKLVPVRFSNWPEPQGRDDSIKELTQELRIPERLSGASVCVNDPFDSVHNLPRRYD
jgi:hypothetical protein